MHFWAHTRGIIVGLDLHPANLFRKLILDDVHLKRIKRAAGRCARVRGQRAKRDITNARSSRGGIGDLDRGGPSLRTYRRAGTTL